MPIPFRSRDEPTDEPADETQSDFARRVLAHAGTPEEKLKRLLAERSSELEEQARRFEQAMEDLERREELLRDMRASVDRILRLGANELREREAELQDRDRENAEREARLAAGEAELNRRRSELGAVELKREAVEQRERVLAAREQALAEAEAQREQPAGERQPEEHGGVRAQPEPVSLLFVPGPAYRLVETEPEALVAGGEVELDGAHYVVTRVGRAPLHSDARRCAYLERGVPDSSASAGSS
jgi:hypothetical protein